MLPKYPSRPRAGKAGMPNLSDKDRQALRLAGDLQKAIDQWLGRRGVQPSCAVSPFVDTAGEPAVIIKMNAQGRRRPGGPVQLLEADDHGVGHLGVHLDDHGRLPGRVDEGGDSAGRLNAATAQPLIYGPLQVGSEPERLPVLLAEVRHASLPRSWSARRLGEHRGTSRYLRFLGYRTHDRLQEHPHEHLHEQRIAQNKSKCMRYRARSGKGCQQGQVRRNSAGRKRWLKLVTACQHRSWRG